MRINTNTKLHIEKQNVKGFLSASLFDSTYTQLIITSGYIHTGISMWMQ